MCKLHYPLNIDFIKKLFVMTVSAMPGKIVEFYAQSLLFSFSYYYNYFLKRIVMAWGFLVHCGDLLGIELFEHYLDIVDIHVVFTRDTFMTVSFLVLYCT